MQDSLTITDFELWTRIGVSTEERATEQRLLVTIEMLSDSRAAAMHDDVKKTINYFDVSEDMKKLVTTERRTIERFAEDAAQVILEKYKPDEVTVRVKKFAIPGTAYISATIQRS